MFIFLINYSGFACTFFMSTLNGKTWFGNNEDFMDADTNIWFFPPEAGKYGRLYFGYNNGFPQGGMNDHGLCFDGASTPPSNLKFSGNKKLYDRPLMDKIMEECATVEEVLKVVDEYAFQDLATQGQLMVVDRKGDAVIIGGPGKNGEDVDIIRKQGSFMVCTNFFPNNRNKGGYPCDRFEMATEKLNDNSDPNVENFRSILNLVHVENPSGSGVFTVYSNIFDLNNNEIYVYFFHNFAEVVKLKFEDEFKKGAHAYKIRDLFPESKLPLKALNDFVRNTPRSSPSLLIPKFVPFEKRS